MSTCNCVENNIELKKQLDITQKQLAEIISAFEEHIDALDSARKSYHDSTLWYHDGHQYRIDEAEQKLWNLKEQLKNTK